MRISLISLKNFSHDVDTVYDEGLTGHPNAEVWQAAQSARRFLITQDLDFSNAQLFVPGTHCGILLLRLRSPSRTALIDRVTELFVSEDVRKWEGCFVVSTDRKIRVLQTTQRP